MGFTWECDGNTLEEKGMIEDSLPEGFTYKIAKYKLIERSEIKEEIKFRAFFFCERVRQRGSHYFH